MSYFDQKLRTGYQGTSGPCRTTRYDADGKVVEIREQTVEQIKYVRRQQARVAKLSPEEKAKLLAQLEQGDA